MGSSTVGLPESGALEGQRCCSRAFPHGRDFPTVERCLQWQSPGVAAGNHREGFLSVWEGTRAFSRGYSVLGL